MEAEAAKSNRKQDINERTTEEMNADAKAEKKQYKSRKKQQQKKKEDTTEQHPVPSATKR